jgi:tetratricopeptide (TPR) repeat protein
LRCCQARHTFSLGRLREAETLCRQGIAALDSLPPVANRKLDAYLHLILSRTLIHLRRSTEARTAAENALSTFSRFEDDYGSAWTTLTLGIAIHESGENREASIYIQQAVSLGEQIGSQRVVAYGWGMMASIFNILGDYEQALEYSQRSLEIRRRFGDWRGIAYCLQVQGALAGETGKPKLAIDLLRQSVAIAEDIGEQILQRMSMWILGFCHHQDGDLDESLRVYRRGLALAEQDREYFAGKAWFQAGLALPLDALGMQEEARANLNSALRTFFKIDAPYETLDALRISVQILAGEGQMNKVAQLLAFIEQNSIGFRFHQQWAHDMSATLPLSRAEREAALYAGSSMSLNEALALALS